ncbi:MAG: hypothetical protein JW889_09495 [Verrucomicrobia bacterium]|nr:hypothetical protein [Verrucomicrobiota bacterium]
MLSRSDPETPCLLLVSVESLKGGVGKSVMAMWLAAMASQAPPGPDCDILLIDMDVLGSGTFLDEPERQARSKTLTLLDIVLPSPVSRRSAKTPVRVRVLPRGPSGLVTLTLDAGAEDGRSFEYIGMTSTDRSELGRYSSEAQSLREFNGLFRYLLGRYKATKRSLLAIVDMPPGRGSWWRALGSEARAAVQDEPCLIWRSVLLTIPTFAQLDCVADPAVLMADTAAGVRQRPQIVVNMVTPEAARWLRSSARLLLSTSTRGGADSHIVIRNLSSLRTANGGSASTEEPAGIEEKLPTYSTAKRAAPDGASSFCEVLDIVGTTTPVLPSQAIYLAYDPSLAMAFSIQRRVVALPMSLPSVAPAIPGSREPGSLAGLLHGNIAMEVER